MCVILAFGFFSVYFSCEVYAQENVVSRNPKSEIRNPSEDVVEIETDIGTGDIKANLPVKDQKRETKKKSAVISDGKSPKTGIKPRAQYQTQDVSPETEVLKSKRDDGKAKVDEQEAAAQRQAKVDAQLRAAEKDSEGGIESEMVKETAAVEEFIPANPEDVITDKQVVIISESLRKLIDENDQLKKQLNGVDQQLKNLRGEQKLGGNRMQEITIERDALRQQTVNIANHNSENEKLVKDLQEKLAQKEKEYEAKIIGLQNELASIVRNPAVAETTNSSLDEKPATGNAVVEKRSISVNVASAPSIEDTRKEGKMIMAGVNALQSQRSQLRRDEAKLHYNMGNTYYNQGDYLSSVEEYKKAVELAPEDSSAHYNLAFVSSEILNHPKLAVIHYKQYLFLNPNAEDAEKVRQKIIENEILLKGNIHFESNLNEEVRHKKNEFNEVSSY